MSRTRGLIAVLLVSAAAVGGGLYALRERPLATAPAAPPPGPPPSPAAAPRPEDAGGSRLYCQFYVFTEQRPRVAFYFEVLRGGDAATYRQIYVAEDNGQRQDFQDADRPEWRFDATAQPPRIVGRISVPDASQAGLHDEDIAIELYGYAPDADSPVFFEASLKNVHYQNLPGKCRQSGAPA